MLHFAYDPSSATGLAGRRDCNRDAMAGFAAAEVRRRGSHSDVRRRCWKNNVLAESAAAS
jgi:hypothetical protein